MSQMVIVSTSLDDARKRYNALRKGKESLRVPSPAARVTAEEDEMLLDVAAKMLAGLYRKEIEGRKEQP